MTAKQEWFSLFFLFSRYMVLPSNKKADAVPTSNKKADAALPSNKKVDAVLPSNKKADAVLVSNCLLKEGQIWSAIAEQTDNEAFCMTRNIFVVGLVFLYELKYLQVSG
jgi:hypothetical protein